MTAYRWFELAMFVFAFAGIAVFLTAVGTLAARKVRQVYYRRRVWNLIRKDAEKAIERRKQRAEML